ncbi:MAG: hypothetical protein CBC01_01635, partial [Betaproteobacteria bacterium TMED41]
MSATANPTFSILGQGGTGGETYAVSTDYFSFNRGDTLDLALPTSDENGNNISATPFLYIPGAAGSGEQTYAISLGLSEDWGGEPDNILDLQSGNHNNINSLGFGSSATETMQHSDGDISIIDIGGNTHYSTPAADRDYSINIYTFDSGPDNFGQNPEVTNIPIESSLSLGASAQETYNLATYGNTVLQDVISDRDFFVVNHYQNESYDSVYGVHQVDFVGPDDYYVFDSSRAGGWHTGEGGLAYRIVGDGTFEDIVGSLSQSSFIGAGNMGVYIEVTDSTSANYNDVYFLQDGIDFTKVFDSNAYNYSYAHDYRIIGKDSDGDGQNDITALSIISRNYDGSERFVNEVDVHDVDDYNGPISFGSAETISGTGSPFDGTVILDGYGNEITPLAGFDTYTYIDSALAAANIASEDVTSVTYDAMWGSGSMYGFNVYQADGGSNPLIIDLSNGSPEYYYLDRSQINSDNSAHDPHLYNLMAVDGAFYYESGDYNSQNADVWLYELGSNGTNVVINTLDDFEHYPQIDTDSWGPEGLVTFININDELIPIHNTIVDSPT